MFNLNCRALALALVLPLLGGCFVTSENPVMRAGENGRDSELRGLWVSEKGREFLHVMRPEREDGQDEASEAHGFSGLYVVSGGEAAEDRDSWARVRIVSTRVKDRNILSMRFSEGESGGDLDDMPGWLIFSYEVREGRLYLHMIEEDAVDDAIKSGRLKGKPKTQSSSDPHVTASAAEWIKFLEEADLTAMFDEDDASWLARLPAAAIRESIGMAEEAADSEADPESEQTEDAGRDVR